MVTLHFRASEESSLDDMTSLEGRDVRGYCNV
jgi:hypothetical protein